MDSGRVDTVMLRDSQITIYNLAPKSWQTFLAANAKTINVVHNHFCFLKKKKKKLRDFPGGAVVKNPPANAGDTGSSPGPARSHMPWSN